MYFKIKENQLCTFCEKEKETIKHLFIECPHVLKLWKLLENSIEGSFKPTVQSVVLNKVSEHKCTGEDALVLFTKYYIYAT